MRLSDLEPRWIYKNKIFAFWCPHCRKVWLTCKRVVMEQKQQREIIELAFGDEAPNVVGCKESYAWKFSTFDFSTISVTASLDASQAGHWHGCIMKGQIVGGV